MRQVSLYIHIPFCVKKCVYCDFASYPGQEALWHRYYSALIEELCSWQSALSDAEIPTVFLGGGTPSLPPAEETIRLMDAVRSLFSVAPDAEITLANPGTLTPDKLRFLRSAGVNRLSLGVQSFDDGLLKALGRIHTAAQAEETVHAARAAGFTNLSLDLMYGLPGQTLPQWKGTLRRAVKLAPEHISAYSLIVEEGTPLYEDVMSGKTIVPDEDAVLEMQRLAVRTLAENGYARYEISNYAKAGFESRHNSVYWRGGEYLGIGCAAHSLIANERFENPRALTDYLAGQRMLERQARTETDIWEEALMLRTRMTEGILLGDRLERLRPKLARKELQGLFTLEGDRLRLTEKGMEVQDAIILLLLEGT